MDSSLVYRIVYLLWVKQGCKRYHAAIADNYFQPIHHRELEYSEDEDLLRRVVQC